MGLKFPRGCEDCMCGPTLWFGLERGKDLGFESFQLTRRKDGETSKCGTKDGDSSGFERSTGRSNVGGRSSPDWMPRLHGAAMGLQDGEFGGRAPHGVG